MVLVSLGTCETLPSSTLMWKDQKLSLRRAATLHPSYPARNPPIS